MKIDGHPFPTNMVELKEKGADEEVKILTSGQAKHSGAVDLKSQASVNQLGGRADMMKEKVPKDLVDVRHHRC